MKLELIKNSLEHGFRSIDNLTVVYDSYYYLWLCELQRWLRETHSVIVEITYQMCSTGWEFCSYKFDNDLQSEDDMDRETGYKTYELALEAGLNEALKTLN